MKPAIKFGFGIAFGMWLFEACRTVVDDRIRKKFDGDAEFRVQVKKISPTLYVRYRKETANVEFSDFA